MLATALLVSGTVCIIIGAVKNRKPSSAADDAALLVTNPVLIGTAELGEYPQTYVGDELNEKLKNDGIRTGKIYTAMMDGKQTEFYEYSYENRNYVEVNSTIDLTNVLDAAFTDGTVMVPNETYFFAVTPILWDIFRQGEQIFAVAHNTIATVNFIDDALGNQTMWNNSYLQSWLNNYFINNAALGNLAATRNYYASSPTSDTDGESMTDKMWTPSFLEIQQFYPLNADRIKALNDFASVGAYMNSGIDFYLLRTTNGQNEICKVRNADHANGQTAGTAYTTGGKGMTETCVPAFVLSDTAIAEIYGIPATLPDINYDGNDHTVKFDFPTNLTGTFSYQYTRDGVTVNNMTTVGDYTVKVYVDGYLVGTTAVSIKPATIGTVTLSQDSYQYTGNAILPTLTAVASDKVLTPDVDYVLTATNNVTAGTASYTVTGIGNYQGTLTGNFTIVPQVVARPTVDATNYVYNGEPQTYQIATHDAYAISPNTTQTNAGQYSVIVSLKNTRDYVWDNQTTGNLTYVFNIARQAITIPAPQNVDLDANDELLVKAYYQSELYSVQSVRSTDGTDATEYKDVIVQTGSYKVTLTLNDTQNYLWQNGTDGTVTVDFAINVTYEDNELTGTVRIDDWTYGDTASDPDGVTAKYGTPTYYYTTDTDVADLDAHNFNLAEWTPWFNNVPRTAGDYYVIAYVPATDAAHDAVHSAVTKVTIAPKTITVSQVVMAVKTFDGTTAGAGQIVLDGIVVGDIVNASGNIAWADSAAGTRNFIVTDLTVDNANYVLDSDNYQGTDANGILYRVVMRPTADTREFTYNGREQRYDIIRSDYYTVDGATQSDAGDYTVTVALNDAVNYQWDDGTHDDLTFPFVIAKANLTVTVAMADFRVNDEPTAPVITATLNGVAFTDLPFVITYLAVDEADAEPTETIPTAVGNYRVMATLTDHTNFNDVTAVGYCQIYQLISAADGLGSLVIAADGSYRLTLAAQDAKQADNTTSVNYAMQITRDGTPVETVSDIELQILVPPALQDLAKADDVVAFDLLQKHLSIMVTAGDNTQKINQFNLVTKDGQVYAVFAYSGAGQADVTFAYTVTAGAGFNWGIFLGSALAVASVIIFVVALVLVLKMKKRKTAPAAI